MSEILLRGEKIILRKTTDLDKNTYRLMRQQRYNDQKPYEDSLFEMIWEDLNSSYGICFTIFTKEEEHICGFIEIPFIHAKTPEIAIDILDEYQKKGFGSEAVSLVFSYMKKTYRTGEILWNVREENRASRSMAEKKNATLMQISHGVASYLIPI